MDEKEKIEFYKRKIQKYPKNPELHFNLAKVYSEINLWDDAVISFQKAIELDCHHIKSYIELSNLLYSIDMIDKAVEVCQLGIDFNPESSALYYLLEQLYEILGEYDLASQTLEDLLNIDEGYNKAYEALGRLAIVQNRFDEANVWLEKLIELDPQNVNAYIYLANISRKQKNFDKAIYYLYKALNIEPDNLDVYNDLGLIYLEFANYDKAKKQFEFVISKDKSYSYAYDNLGFIYRKEKEYDKAEEALKQSLSINLQAWTYNELALIYTETGKYQDSIECSKKALAIDSNYAYAYDNLGAVYRKLGYIDKAEEVLNESLKLKPDDSWTFNQLGLLNYEKGRYLSAKANFIKSAELDYKHYWPRINQASCYIKEKNYALANSYLDTLIEKYSDNSRVFMLKSKLQFILDNYNEAVKFAELAIEKDPQDALAFTNLGLIYRDLDEFDKAEEYFVKATNTSRPKDSSVYLEYAILNIYRQEYDKCLYHCIKAQELDELNYNIYCIMAIVENSSDVETKLIDYIRATEVKFPDKKELFMSYASAFMELGLPEESEKYFNLALKVDQDYKDAQHGLAQAYMLMNLYDNSLQYAFLNTDNTENIELCSYCNSIVALNYKRQGNLEKLEKYKNEAILLNPTIHKELFQKYKIRKDLKYKVRTNFFKDLSEMYKENT